MSVSKNHILNVVEKFLQKESIGQESNEDKFSKNKFCLKTEDGLSTLYDSECSIKCIIEEEALSKAISNLKKGKKDAHGESKFIYLL